VDNVITNIPDIAEQWVAYAEPRPRDAISISTMRRRQVKSWDVVYDVVV